MSRLLRKTKRLKVVMEVNELQDNQGDPNRPVVGTVAFLAISATFAFGITFAVSICYRLLGKHPGLEVLVFAGVSGFVVSSAGWFVVMRGFTKAPERMLGYFGAGMLIKLILIGLTVLLVNVFEIASLSEFFVPFAAVFFLTGFAQLFIAVKGATKLLNEANKGRVWQQPAAPGVARSPQQRAKSASEGD